jgi:UPF0755 protein
MLWLKRLFIGAMILMVGLGSAVFMAWQAWQKDGPLATDKTVIFSRGMGVREISEKLEQEGVVQHAELFLAWSVITKKHTLLKAGEYNFSAYISAADAAQMIADGKTVIRKVTIPEGLSVFQIVAILQTTDGLEGEVTTTLREGELLPETYHFSYGDNREEIVQRMRRDMRAALSDAWEKRAANISLKTPEELLTLASIVEKETGVKDERSRVAAVYLNRLKIGMKLQADPTVLYPLTQGRYDKERVLYKDLEISSPYNTYKYTGLPPGPIANPGRASLMAVAQPVVSDELYFVADGKGGHVFARTLKEHNVNVANYRQMMKEK